MAAAAAAAVRVHKLPLLLACGVLVWPARPCIDIVDNSKALVLHLNTVVSGMHTSKPLFWWRDCQHQGCLAFPGT